MSYKPGFYYLNAVTDQLTWWPLVVVKENPDLMYEPHVYQSWIITFENEYESMLNEVDEIVSSRILSKEKERKERDKLKMHASIY